MPVYQTKTIGFRHMPSMDIGIYTGAIYRVYTIRNACKLHVFFIHIYLGEYNNIDVDLNNFFK